MAEFTKEERQILERYFTNLDEDVFGLINLPDEAKGVLFNWYSRSDKSLRRVLLDEFIKNERSGLRDTGEVENQSGVNTKQSESSMTTKKVEEFYGRMWAEYGHDNVAELVGVHLAVENVSQMIGAKALEDNRVGLSYWEKSTRYVRYDDKVDGEYRFLREPRIMKSKWARLYERTNNELFDTYAELVEKMTDWVKKRYPRGKGVKEEVYQDTVHVRANGICRQLLPLSALTHVGLFGNGRSFEYLIIKMLVSPYTEVREKGKEMKQELGKMIPGLVKRSTNGWEKEWQRYLKTQNLKLKREVEKIRAQNSKVKATTEKLKGLGVEIKATDVKGGEDQRSTSDKKVTLISFDRDGEEKMLAGMMYGLTGRSFEEGFQQVKWMERKEREALVETYCSGRKNWDHRLGRALEMADYVFEMKASIGCYKDLQRHRMLTPLVQSFNTVYGYEVPKEVIEAGLEQKYVQAMDQAAEAFEKIGKSYPLEAQYMIPLGYGMRWVMKMNLREVSHVTELRSQKEEDAHVRMVAQKMADEVRKVHPLLAKWATEFVDNEKGEAKGEEKTVAKKKKLRERNG